LAKIAIFDYGAGNIFSLKSALERNGAESVEIIFDLKDLEKFDGLVLPGVGNFDPAIRSIEGSAQHLGKAIGSGMPVMGICLGMEMLFDRSEEGELEGLKILDGDVILLPKRKVKIPHMGWNNLQIKGDSRLLKGVRDNSWVYFVHSYHTVPKDRKLVVASSDYGVSIPAVIERDNLIGVQFHPEKSGDVGAIMIKNFIEICDNEAK
jgi:glutamine amidotransferase